jgi:CheY-like chemotaxis protein
MNRKILGHMLKKQYHCELIFASNGEDAVKKWSENDLDIIFMDIQMPGINGLDATQMIRRQEGEKNKRRTPIIASTAIDSSTLDKGITAAAGMDGYIMKPYGKKQVHEIIRLHTSRSKKVCSGSESDVGVGDNDSDSDSRPLTPTPPIKTRKNLGNGFPPRLPASWSTPSDGGKLLEKFHFLGNKRNLAMGGLLASGVMPPPSPFTRSRL